MGNGRNSGLPKGVRNRTGDYDFSKFRVWSQRATGDYGYGNDVLLQMYARLESNADDLIQAMTWVERNHFDNWIAGYFMGDARLPYKDLGASSQRMVQTFDKYIDQSYFYESIVVKSLAGNSLLTGSRAPILDEDYKSDIEGSIIKFNMPRSSAAAAEGLTIGNSGKNVEYSFYIPVNTKGVGMFIISPKINSQFEEEQREVILGRDTYWRVGPRKWNESRQIWEIPMYYVGKDKHKY